MKKKILISLLILAVLAAAVIGVTKLVKKNQEDELYLKAYEAMENGEYDQADQLLDQLHGYEGAEELRIDNLYQKAVSLFDAGEEDQAAVAFLKITDYQDVKTYLDHIYLHRAQAFSQTQDYTQVLSTIALINDQASYQNEFNQLYLEGAKYYYQQNDVQTAYDWWQKISLAPQEEQSFQADLFYAYARNKFENGEIEEAKQQLAKIASDERAVAMNVEIDRTMQAVSCLLNLQKRYTISVLEEVRYCPQNNQSAGIEDPIIMIRYQQQKNETSEELYSIYENQSYLVTCRSLGKEGTDLSNPSDLAGYMKLSKNWDNSQVIVLNVQAIRMCLEKNGT